MAKTEKVHGNGV